MNVGFIGLGIMGKPMAKQLAKAGVSLYVADLNQEAVAELVTLGAKSATYAQMGQLCQVVFTILPTGDIVQQVIFGQDGLCSTLQAGSVICDFSSVTPEQSQHCYNRLKPMGIGFVDCPVSGGEPKAIDGTLSMMAGGDQSDFDTLLPYFHMMGSSALRIGDSGAGSVTKLTNQVIVNLNIAAMSEAFVLAAKAGVDPEKVFLAIEGGLAGSTILSAKMPMILERNFAPGGTIAVNHKDIKNVMATAHALDVPMPFTSQLFELMQSLKITGHMGDDHCGIIHYFEQLSGVTVKKEG